VINAPDQHSRRRNLNRPATEPRLSMRFDPHSWHGRDEAEVHLGRPRTVGGGSDLAGHAGSEVDEVTTCSRLPEVETLRDLAELAVLMSTLPQDSPKRISAGRFSS
jgi:hypothetical protein